MTQKRTGRPRIPDRDQMISAVKILTSVPKPIADELDKLAVYPASRSSIVRDMLIERFGQPDERATA
jgi:hypothetical protein